MTKNAITWIREDFRIEHNPALSYATQNHENVIALYIYNKTDFDNKREAQKWWLFKSLETFKSELTKYKINLQILVGDEVDIFSKLTLNFDNKFKSKISCSFRDNVDQRTIINFENGSLSINQTWVPDRYTVIEQKKGNIISNLDFKNNENIYSYQIQSISEQILDKKITPKFPSMSLEEIDINTKLLSNWINL